MSFSIVLRMEGLKLYYSVLIAAQMGAGGGHKRTICCKVYSVIIFNSHTMFKQECYHRLYLRLFESSLYLN